MKMNKMQWCRDHISSGLVVIDLLVILLKYQHCKGAAERKMQLPASISSGIRWNHTGSIWDPYILVSYILVPYIWVPYIWVP